MSITPGTIALGQQWMTNAGFSVKVIEHISDTIYCWKVQVVNNDSNLIYAVTDNGSYINDQPSPHFDLKHLESGSVAEPTVEPVAPTEQRLTIPVSGDELAAETLEALGYRFDGQCWVQDQVSERDGAVLSHPLYPVLIQAIEQAMYGKGGRHGGNVTPFLDQPWAHYVKMHGRGFATGQATKKLEEAASTREGDAFDTEVLGAIVYAGMSILKNRGLV